MLKILVLSLLLFFLPLGVQAQGEFVPSASSKITLSSGEVYRGEVLEENDQMLMLKASDGSRYLLRKNEIVSVEPYSTAANDVVLSGADNNMPDFAGNKFSMLVDLSGGASFSRNSYGWVPAMQGALVLGARDVLFPNTFAGIGAGYNLLFAGGGPEEFISLVPVFVRLQSIMGKRATAPYVEIDAGYGFSFSQDVKGGMMLRLSAGVAHKFSSRTVLYAGVYGSLQGLSGAMRDIDSWGNVYKYDGTTTAQQIGAKVALRF